MSTALLISKKALKTKHRFCSYYKRYFDYVRVPLFSLILVEEGNISPRENKSHDFCDLFNLTFTLLLKGQ